MSDETDSKEIAESEELLRITREQTSDDDLDAKIIARAAHLLAPPPPTPEQRLAAVVADLYRERAAWLDEMRRGNEALSEVCRDRDQLRALVFALEDRVRELEARPLRLPEVEPQAQAPQVRTPRPDCTLCHGTGHYAQAWAMGPDADCSCSRLPEIAPTFPAAEVEELP